METQNQYKSERLKRLIKQKTDLENNLRERRERGELMPVDHMLSYYDHLIGKSMGATEESNSRRTGSRRTGSRRMGSRRMGSRRMGSRRMGSRRSTDGKRRSKKRSKKRRKKRNKKSKKRC